MVFPQIRELFRSKSTVHYKRHVNPDGTPGGEVSVHATVHETATIDKGALVLEGAAVGPNEVVESGQIVLPYGEIANFE